MNKNIEKNENKNDIDKFKVITFETKKKIKKKNGIKICQIY